MYGSVWSKCMAMCGQGEKAVLLPKCVAQWEWKAVLLATCVAQSWFLGETLELGKLWQIV